VGGTRGRGRASSGSAARGRKREPQPGSVDLGPSSKGVRTDGGNDAVSVDLCDLPRRTCRTPTVLDEGLIGRIVDVTLPRDASTERGPHRLCIVGFDRVNGSHIVEPLGAEPDDASGPRSLDLQELTRTGLVELVDGQDELLRHGHVLIGERIRFLPSEADGGESDDAWLNATVIGWWPQDVLPPVATQRGAGGPNGAVFVAEDTDGDRWQLSLADAILALVGTPSAGPSRRGARFLEVFAGSCALSVAFWRLGVEAEMYDLRLSERHDFRKDDVLLKQLAASDIDLVHIAPPESFALDATAMSRLLSALRTIHERGGNFVVECGQRCGLWATGEMQRVAALGGVEPLSVDLQDFGAERPAPTRLLTNCAGWLEPALAAGLSAARPEAGQRATSQPAMPDGGEQYPRAFVDAYAKGAIQALGL